METAADNGAAAAGAVDDSTIKELVKAKKLPVDTVVSGPGTVTVHAHRQGRQKTVTIGTATKKFGSAGSGTLTLKLTSAGTKLLAAAKTAKKAVKVTVSSSFKPKSGKTATSKKNVSIT